MTLEEELIDHIGEICGCVENCGNCKYYGVDNQCYEKEYLKAILEAVEQTDGTR